MQVFYFLLAFVASAVLADDDRPFEGDKVFRIIPANQNEVEILVKWLNDAIGMDVWRDPSHAHQPVDVHVPANQVEETTTMLRKYGIDFKYMIDNVETTVEIEEKSNQKNAFDSSFNYDKYNQYDDIITELKKLAAAHPSQASTFYVGKTYEKRNMMGIKITGRNSGRSKEAVWIDGGIHAREWITPAVVMFFTKHLLESTSSSVTSALSKYDFYILPVFNADGYAHTFTGRRERMWRKTRSQKGWGCIGADPNRNWNYKWGGVGTSSNPCQDTYHGERAHSEVEVANVARYLGNIPNLKSYWNVHAYSQLVLTPWSYKSELPRDYNEIKRVAQVFTTEVRKRYGTSYRYGPPPSVLYAVSGGSIDYTYAVLGVKYSYALELRDTGRYGFLLPAYLIKPTAEETTDAILAAVNAM